MQAIVSPYCNCVLNRFNKATETSKGKLYGNLSVTVTSNHIVCIFCLALSLFNELRIHVAID